MAVNAMYTVGGTFTPPIGINVPLRLFVYFPGERANV
jgi:hypothetical protein